MLSPTFTPARNSIPPTPTTTTDNVQLALNGDVSSAIRSSVASVLRDETSKFRELNFIQRIDLLLYSQNCGQLISTGDLLFCLVALCKSTQRGLATQIIYNHLVATQSEHLEYFKTYVLSNIPERADLMESYGIGLPAGDYSTLIKEFTAHAAANYEQASSFLNMCSAHIKLAQLLVIEKDDELVTNTLKIMASNIHSLCSNLRNTTAFTAILYVLENTKSDEVIKHCVSTLIALLPKLTSFQHYEMLPKFEGRYKHFTAEQRKEVAIYFEKTEALATYFTFSVEQAEDTYQRYVALFDDHPPHKIAHPPVVVPDKSHKQHLMDDKFEKYCGLLEQNDSIIQSAVDNIDYFATKFSKLSPIYKKTLYNRLLNNICVYSPIPGHVLMSKDDDIQKINSYIHSFIALTAILSVLSKDEVSHVLGVLQSSMRNTWNIWSHPAYLNVKERLSFYRDDYEYCNEICLRGLIRMDIVILGLNIKET